MDLIYFILCSFGLTQILVYGKIFSKIRPSGGFLGDLLSCPMCTGFWVGIFLWTLNGQTRLFSFDTFLFTGLCLGWLSSGTSYIISVLFDDDGIKVHSTNKERRTKTNYRRWK